MSLDGPLGRGREARQCPGRPDRTAHEVSTTVRTFAAQAIVHALSAEGALERADAGIGTTRRQIPVAAFTVGPKVEHPEVISQTSPR